MTFYPRTVLIFVLFIATSMVAQEQQKLPLVYNVSFCDKAIEIDGEIDSIWEQADWSNSFVDIEGDVQSAPYLETKFKMLWGEAELYLLAWLEEPHIWATLKNHDDIVYRDNDFEVFIDPDGDTHNYMEIEVNAFNTILDLFLPKPYREGGPLQMNWTAENLRTAIGLLGTINHPNDTDSAWIVEMALPFSSIGTIPSPGDHWRINFSRVHYDLDVLKGVYSKKKDSADRVLPEYNWVWSPQGIINMHYPEKWGYVFFHNDHEPMNSEHPSDARARSILYDMYYHQRTYFRKNGSYDTLIPKQISINGKATQLIVDKMEPTAYTVKIQWENQYIHLQQDGKIWTTDL